MSRSGMGRGGRAEPTPPECALAAEMFDHFSSAGTMKQILALHREICNTLLLKPHTLPDFYPKLKVKLSSSWKAQALFKKFDLRASHKVYAKGRACTGSKVLIIGAGPCGLRAAVECQLLGAKVVVVEKRDRVSRNNVLHLWPFVIQDLRALGAKKFFGKFCAGAIDHISIRQLQCILLKVALLLGVEFHEGVSFEELLEPTGADSEESVGWRARVSPAEHPVSQYEFDVLVGADGKRNTLRGFKRKEFRGKLAMAITANFINRHTEQEASVPEISGVAFIFNQKFFKELYAVTGIDLENIVYYKDDTHYFVMTAKKHSLLDKGVLLHDLPDVTRLLSAQNVDRAALMRYAREAARFSTDGRLPLRDFALNHYGEPDIALFDFTSMYAAENASMVKERHGRRLLCQLVGDSLLEPFWPTGSGCARGFLSALDAAWAVRAWGQSPAPHPLEVIAERESIYRLLAQTTPENLHRDFGAYTLDPGTRYPTLNRGKVTPHQVIGFYDSDEPLPLDAPTAKKRRREAEVSEETLVAWVGLGEGGLRAAVSPGALAALVRRYRPDLLPAAAPAHTVYHVLHKELGIAPWCTSVAGTGVQRDVPDARVRAYLARVYGAFKGNVPHIHHQSDAFEQIKRSQQREKHGRNSAEHTISMYSNAADTHSSNRKKRRSVRAHAHVSNDRDEYISRKIGKLDLDLIEGRTTAADGEAHAGKQRKLRHHILTQYEPEGSPHPDVLRDSYAHLLQSTTKMTVHSKNMPEHKKLMHFFQEHNTAPVKPPRRLKGLDANSVKVPDFSDVFDDSKVGATVFEMEKMNNNYVDAPSSSQKIKKLVRSSSFAVPQKKDFVRSSSTDVPKKFVRSASVDSYLIKDRRLATLIYKTNSITKRDSQSPETAFSYGRSHSIESAEVTNTRQNVKILKKIEKTRTPCPDALPRSGRSGPVTTVEMALRVRRMSEMIDAKCLRAPSPDRSKAIESIGSLDMAARRQRIADLIQGLKTDLNPEPASCRRSSSDMAMRVLRVSDTQRQSGERRVKSGGRRRAARELMRQRFEKSLQMLAAEPRPDFAPSADLEHDYGLQQYRASAPHFGERVKNLEKQLQHYEETRAVGVGTRAGGGARVARLAAELAGAGTGLGAGPAPPSRAFKPKDLMRAVGKIERDDWNVKEIERKILENQLGRPEPRAAERVPKWDREQFLGRQRRLKESEGTEEKWGEIDETLHKLDQKLRDAGRPDHGTKKVANLATKFVKTNEPAKTNADFSPKEEVKKRWVVGGGAGAGVGGARCAACGARVFAAEGVTADGLHLHRSCFRCAVCNAVLRPGNYTTERYGSRLVCLRHGGGGGGGGGGASVPDTAATMVQQAQAHAPPTPERISLELSDGAREIDEDEWTDRNFLASETSGAGTGAPGLSSSEDEQSSSDEDTEAAGSGEEAGDSGEEAEGSGEEAARLPHAHSAHALYFSDDSFGYDEYSDDGAESSGNESCSRMRMAREERRREVPLDARARARPPTDSSEVESEEESESSGTEVSTDSEFAREECTAPAPSPPAILVTEAPAPALAPAPPLHHAHDYPHPLSRARSAGGLATKRALELKRKYLLGEPSPPAVRKSDSTSQLDTKLNAFQSNITEFQKMLHPAPQQPHHPIVTFQLSPEARKAQPMPDIIKNLCDAPVDLLTKGDSPLCKNEWREETIDEEKKEQEDELDSDSLSEDVSSHTDTAPQSVPRVEVHDEGGELIQLDSLTVIDSGAEEMVTAPAPSSSSSESCREATTLALTETELSDWAAESAALDDCNLDERDDKKRNQNLRTLSGLKMVHDAKNVSAITSHVCGRTSPEPVVYSNAAEHFEFVDEGEEDPSIEQPGTPRNEGYMELVDDPYSPSNDRSMNFIERSFSETIVISSSPEASGSRPTGKHETGPIENERISENNESKIEDNLTPSQLWKSIETESSEKSSSDSLQKSDTVIKDLDNSSKVEDPVTEIKLESPTSLSDLSPPLESTEAKPPASIQFNSKCSMEDMSPPLAQTPKSIALSNCSNVTIPFSSPCTIRLYAPAICRSASETFHRSTSRSTDSPTRSFELSVSINLSSGSISPVAPRPMRDTTNKIQEIKRERDEQTDVVRRLVLERLGSGPHVARKSTRRTRVSPRVASSLPPPVPPPPILPTPPPPPPPPPRPAPPLMLPVTPSFSDPELARERRRKSIMRSISNYLNRRLGPRHKWHSDPDLTSHEPPQQSRISAHKSTGALQEAPPPVPPPPASYTRPRPRLSPSATQPGASLSGAGCVGAAAAAPGDADERDAMQLWFEARDELAEPHVRRVARLERRLARPFSGASWSGAGCVGAAAAAPGDADERDAMQLWFEARDELAETHARRVARLERRLARPLSAEQQAATVAELVQVSAQRGARHALHAADRRRSGVAD